MGDEGQITGGAKAGLLQRVSGAMPLIKAAGLTVYAVAVGALYVAGFLAVNSNLARKGILDIEFANARYFMAGATFVVFALFFYLFAGRAVVLGKKWLADLIALRRKLGCGQRWELVLFVYSHLHVLFFCCFSTAAFSAFAYGANESDLFYLALMGPFIFVYWFDVSNLDLRYPRVFDVMRIVWEGTAIAAFFVGSYGSKRVMGVFAVYLGLVFFINFVLDKFERYKQTADQVAFTAVYGLTVLAGTAVTYGSVVYGEVRSSVGGAEPRPVSIALNDEAQRAVEVLLGKSQRRLDGELIHQTDTHLYVSVGQKTIRLRASDVLAVESDPGAPNDEFWKRRVEAWAARGAASGARTAASRATAPPSAPK